MVREHLDVDTPAPGSAPSAPPKGGFFGLGLFRSPTRRVVAGVAGGLAERLRVDPALVRVAFVFLTLCGGAGALAYAVLWVSVPEAPHPVEHLDAGTQRGAAVALVVGGLVIGLRAGGLWFGNTLAWSVVLIAAGLGVIWLQGDEGDRSRWTELAQRGPASLMEAWQRGGLTRSGKLRLALGVAVIAAGALTLVVRTGALVAQPGVTLAVVLTAVGVGLIAGPLGWRLLRALASERRERIVSQERAEMAAHLHDSVLQTLALIQRSDQPREMVALARNQERELRDWLNGRSPTDNGSLSRAVERVAASVELQFKVPVEVVTVGDATVDDRMQAVVEATREATVNAAKHSGAGQISIYLEVEPELVTAYVRDQGAGFDPAAVAADRRGIAESIQGRMQRSGGTATIATEPGAGTEVHIVMPRQP